MVGHLILSQVMRVRVQQDHPRKKQMRSGWFKAGQFNLRGKKSRLLSCGCCVARNFKDRELEKEHKKEMRKYKKVLTTKTE